MTDARRTHPLCLTSAELHVLDAGREEDAMTAWKESRCLQVLHKRLFMLQHPEAAEVADFI